MTSTQLERDIMAALAAGAEVEWKYGDDLCDCEYQRFGSWENPYLGTVHEIRLCCMWARLNELFPGLARTLVVAEPQPWNGERDMPRYLWIRQVARIAGMPIGDARRMCEGTEPPKGVPRPAPVARRKRWRFWR